VFQLATILRGVGERARSGREKGEGEEGRGEVCAQSESQLELGRVEQPLCAGGHL